ncbi:protein FAM161B isoform X2 [Varanus komodoensis]|uniref:protein FAM161B isoform X2 n=1 Tax=Varanus komodoensis TaxID=61221 RepID=UPI001CF7989D|nr:protein FAM161B isoform X2 [Varanus komodoensis]
MTVSESQGAAGGAEVQPRQEEIQRAFPIKEKSDSESEVELGSNVTLPNRGNLLDFLQLAEDTVAASSSGERLYDSLQALKSKNRQCLLELGLMYQAKLENNYKPPKDDKELEDFFQDDARLILPANFYEDLRSGNMRRCNSLTDLSIDSSKNEQNRYSSPQSYLKPWDSSITIPQPFRMTLREAYKKSQLLKSPALIEIETAAYKRQSQEEAECQKQFRAQPVPAHIYLPLYQEIMEKNEIRRKVRTQKRKELLLSMQKPFSFQEKEEKRKEAIKQKVLDILTSNKKSVPKIRKKIPKSTYEPMLGDKLKAELLRKIRIQMRAKDLLESSWAPIELSNQQKEKESRIASRNREQKLSFLQDNFSFKPRINRSVPDFERLYWEFQLEARSKREIKEATHNKPFQLRTSNLRCKHRVSNQEMMDFHQPSKAPMQRSRSLIGISSLSSNTLPIYITDAVRKRESAIKLLQEGKKDKENEGVHWAELQRKKCQAMQKSVNCRAKAMDPHKSLAETHKEKLKQNLQKDYRRTREYKKQLEEMKMRVKSRPYLFEQVTKRGAREGVERLFRDTLQQFGLNEEFVRNKGRETTDPIGKEELSESQRSHKSQKNTDADILKELSQEGQRRLEWK